MTEIDDKGSQFIEKSLDEPDEQAVVENYQDRETDISAPVSLSSGEAVESSNGRQDNQVLAGQQTVQEQVDDSDELNQPMSTTQKVVIIVAVIAVIVVGFFLVRYWL
jgi:predicted ATP-grasp superfamily ATP-dependent carboligase